MTNPVPFTEIWRGPFLESLHLGHAVVCDDSGQIVESWGDPDAIVLPRSSSKMIQALPLIESGAADAFGLSPARLALACASHEGAAIHVQAVNSWLADLDLGDDDLTCGPQTTRDRGLQADMIRSGTPTCRVHNNCSGKHTGFLTLGKHLKAGPGYVAMDHPVQAAVLEAWERVTDETVAGHGIDGCSAPNFATSLHGMARAMARFASAPEGSAQYRLTRAMMAHPELVAGKERACTNLMRACEGRAALKTGAEGYFTAILPDLKLGVALKISDGTTRAADCAIAAILVRLGVVEGDHPEVLKYLNAPIRNWDGLQTGWQRAAPTLC